MVRGNDASRRYYLPARNSGQVGTVDPSLVFLHDGARKRGKALHGRTVICLVPAAASCAR